MGLTGFESAGDLVSMVADQRLSATTVLDDLSGRAERHNAQVNAIVARASDRARLEAERRDMRLRRGAMARPLEGVPFTVKDSIEVAGLPTTAGMIGMMGHRSPVNAPAIERLIAAGAVFLGKTNLPEMAGDYQTHNKVFGATRNPWNLAHTPGGSSGGSAVAVSAGLSPLDIGSDLAGSIRIPAHFCGVYGHKPSFGIVPFAGHVPPVPDHAGTTDVAVLGPLARSADDLALALQAMIDTGDMRRPGWHLTMPPPRSHRLQDLRIAYWIDDPDLPVDGAVRDALDAAIEAVAMNGPRELRRARPDMSFAEVRRIGRTLVQGVMGAHLPERTYGALRTVAGRLGAVAPVEASQRRLAKDLTVSYRDWLHADGKRQAFREACARFFEHYDVLLLPAAPVVAPRRRDGVGPERRTINVNGRRRPAVDLGDWSLLASLAYLPATVAPVGLSRQGLPVGIQIVGPELGDLTTIEAARLIGEIAGGYQPPPGFI